jgi:hypothetical protein
MVAALWLKMEEVDHQTYICICERSESLNSGLVDNKISDSDLMAGQPVALKAVHQFGAEL